MFSALYLKLEFTRFLSLTFKNVFEKVSCYLLGHQAIPIAHTADETFERKCRCGSRFLTEDSSLTRIWHHIPCFIYGHYYRKIRERQGYGEYACCKCEHPLMLCQEEENTSSTPGSGFIKKVRYACNLFGHEVREVAHRQEWFEYACHCGHSFLKKEAQLQKIKHPLRCFLTGHTVRFLKRDGIYAEYVCLGCGHTFYL